MNNRKTIVINIKSQNKIEIKLKMKLKKREC